MTKQEVVMMKRKIVSMAAILLVFFSTFGIGLVMADDDVNETSEEITEEETTEDQEEVEEEKEESDEEITEAGEEITEAEEEIEEESAEGVNTTQSEEYNAQAQALLAQARDAWNAGEYKEARKLAKEAKKLAKQAKRGKAFKKMKLLHLYDVFFHQLERHRIGMEAVIEYVNENGDTNAGSEQLVIIKDSFVALESDLETAANADDDKEFRSILKDARELTKDFREEAHSVLGTEGAIGEARTKVNEALKENEEYLKSLLVNIQNSRKESELEIIDEANDEIEARIEKIKEKGEHVEELKDKLDEIKEKRDALKEKLEAAIEACEGVGIGVCDTPEAQEYRALKEEIRQSYKELREISKKIGKAHRILEAVKVSRRVLERIEERISTAEEAGKDVTVAKAKFDEVKGMLDAVEAKYNEGDYEGALAELKNAQKALRGSGIKKVIERMKGAAEEEEEVEEDEDEGEEDTSDRKALKDRMPKIGR
jgi:exonuclease SbcC